MGSGWVGVIELVLAISRLNNCRVRRARWERTDHDATYKTVNLDDEDDHVDEHDDRLIVQLFFTVLNAQQSVVCDCLCVYACVFMVGE